MARMDKCNRILVLDNSEDNIGLVSVLLGSKGPCFEIKEIRDAATLATELGNGRFAAVITDYDLGWMDGIRVTKSVKSLWPKRPVILLAADIKPEQLTDALRAGLDGYVPRTSSGYVRLASVLLELLERESARQATEGLYQRLIEGLHDGILAGSRTTGIIQFNQSLARILGVTDPSELHGKDMDEFLVSAEARSRWAKVVAEGQSLRNLESKILRADGEIGWIRLNLWPFFEKANGQVGYEGTLTDITEFKRAQSELFEREDALKRSHAELEHIPYVVSHDIQEPLQLISRYSMLLKQKLADRKDEDIDRFIGHLLESADRMQSRIDDILQYSRLGSRLQPFKPVDLQIVLGEVVENLRLAIEETGAQIIYHVLPVVTADRVQMLQLFENLVSNAIKFSGGSTPKVQILAMEQGDSWVISVKDNGIGIDLKHHDRIFLMFQRLHTAAEFPGSGIGLAICKKIVDNHGGRIWAESAPGEGSTFHVSIPMRESGFSKAWLLKQEDGMESLGQKSGRGKWHG